MVRTGTTATADQFGEAKMLRKLLGTGAPDGRLTAAPGFTPPSFRASYRASPTAAAGTAIAGLRPPPGAPSGDGRRIVLTPLPGARPSAPSDDLNRDQPRPTQLRLRAPPRNPQPRQLVRRGQSNPPRIRLRPPPNIAASQSASSQTAPAAPPAVARPAAGAAKANAGERLALNLAGAELRDATGLIPSFLEMF